MTLIKKGDFVKFKYRNLFFNAPIWREVTGVYDTLVTVNYKGWPNFIVTDVLDHRPVTKKETTDA